MMTIETIQTATNEGPEIAAVYYGSSSLVDCMKNIIERITEENIENCQNNMQ